MFGGGKSSISAYIAREPIFRKAYDNLADAMVQSTSTTYYGFGEETATAIEAINIAIEDDYPARARALERVLGPGLERLQKKYPDEIADVRGCGALWGVFLSGGPRLLDLARKLSPLRDPQLRPKLVACAVIDALYRDHDIYAYYTLNGRSPMVIGPPLVAEPEEMERVLDALDAVLAQGMPRLLTRFIRERVSSLW